MAITINGSGITSSEIADGTITSTKIADGTITNADINSSAAIAGTKVDGSFGKVLQVVHIDYRNPVAFGAGNFKVMTSTITPIKANSKYLVDIRVSHDRPNASNRDNYNWSLTLGYSATSSNTASDYTSFGGRSNSFSSYQPGLTIGDGYTLYATDVAEGTDQGSWGSDYETPTKTYMVVSPAMGAVGVSINFGLWLYSQTSWVLSGPHYFLNAANDYNGGVSSITITEVAQ